ncbi:MAG: type ISP restriction/modification enzyme [Pseudomonadota bacterium]
MRRANQAVSEPALAPAFQELAERCLIHVPNSSGLVVVPEYNKKRVGRPDIALIRTGAPPRAFIELKAPDKSANPARWRTAHDKRQASRLRELRSWATSNFVDLFLFERSNERGTARIVPEQALDPAQSDTAADKLVRAHTPDAFLDLLTRLAAGAGIEPSAESAQHLAELLAHSSRLVRGIVQERLVELRAKKTTTDPLLDVHSEFRNVLYAHPEAGGYPAQDFDTLFSSAFAQTLAFGLLLVREGGGKPVDKDAYTQMPAEHPLMRTTLRVLTQAEILDVVGMGFDVLLDTVNSFDPAILAAKPNKPDPILYFYEDFLSVFDPEARERHGVYFTPVEVVRFMVGALDRTVRDNIGLTGLRDPNLTILDPATGTGTYLLGVAERVREGALTGGPGRAELELRDLAKRMFGLELLVGPYAVAHYRLHHALQNPSGTGGGASQSRLGVYLADTLSEPGAAAPAGKLGFLSAGISDERRIADEVKSERPILAIVGNPPYRRLEEGEDESLVGRWLNDLWEDLKEPVKSAGKGGQLNTFPELSVAFWRWAMWKLFEAENAPGKGVVAFISNRKFLTGWPYSGLRKMMRDRFDRIEIIDLRGDLRLGPRAGVARDMGVFDIQVGTAITIAIADGSRAGDEAEVHYLDAWAEARYRRPDKLSWLAAGVDQGALPNAVPVHRSGLENFRPEGFAGTGWPSLRECFEFAESGVQTKRDQLVYAPTRNELIDRIRDFLASDPEAVRKSFNEVGRRTVQAAQAVPFDATYVREAAFRPLDRRFHYAHPTYNDRLRRKLPTVWGTSNVGFYTLPNGIGAGPAIWCHGLLPDYHGFRGSYGGYAFPLHDRRPIKAAPNVEPGLTNGLSALYGATVTAEQAFDGILCLLSASTYTQRFAEDLEDVFPHVPFPASHDIFKCAVRLGTEIREIETFARAPALLSDLTFVQLDTPPTTSAVLKVEDPEGTTLTLCADGSGKVTALPETLWTFEVSGYLVLRRWLEGREGQVVDLALFDTFRDICGRIAALVELYASADTVLADALDTPLTRDAIWPTGGGSDE